MVGEFAVQPHEDDLRGAGVPTDVELGVEVDLVGAAVMHHDDDAGRVLAGGFVGTVDDRLQVLLGAHRDDECEDAPGGHLAALFTQGTQRGLDTVGTRPTQVDPAVAGDN